mmetsp:Transcript_3370/g.5023  ORF Transcript_3370/g.5023 Transcript_3370/m.5023 type:complete len:92 (-) Transcript_3370:85-360(-)
MHIQPFGFEHIVVTIIRLPIFRNESCPVPISSQILVAESNSYKRVSGFFQLSMKSCPNFMQSLLSKHVLIKRSIQLLSTFPLLSQTILKIA